MMAAPRAWVLCVTVALGCTSKGQQSSAGDSISGDSMPPTDESVGDDNNGHARGTCTTAVDCGGNPCAVIPDGSLGWHTCIEMVAEATACTGEPGEACCSTADCSSGACYVGPLWYCGGAAPVPANVCVVGECSTDSECNAKSHGLCLPQGAFGEAEARCVYGDCRLDADCTSRSEGECRPFFDPCHGRLIGFSCTYDDSVCRSSADCVGQYCAAGSDGTTSCETFVAPP
jgi:hypothetical protein